MKKLLTIVADMAIWLSFAFVFTVGFGLFCRIVKLAFNMGWSCF